MHSHHEAELRSTARSVTDVVTIIVFLSWASLSFGTLADEWAGSLAVVLALVLVSRPLAVRPAPCRTAARGWTRADLLFVRSTRETGVVPAALVGVLVAERRTAKS